MPVCLIFRGGPGQPPYTLYGKKSFHANKNTLSLTHHNLISQTVNNQLLSSSLLAWPALWRGAYQILIDLLLMSTPTKFSIPKDIRAKIYAQCEVKELSVKQIKNDVKTNPDHSRESFKERIPGLENYSNKQVHDALNGKDVISFWQQHNCHMPNNFLTKRTSSNLYQ